VLRAALQFQTRRRKQMPKTFPLTITVDGKERLIEVPPSDHLVIMPMPLFNMPSFLESKKSGPGIPLIGIQTIHFGADPQQLLSRYKADRVGTIVHFDPLSFARMLAKIAYCTVVAELGYDALEEVYVLPTIRGETDDLGTWVGSGGEATPPGAPDVLHSAMYSVLEKEESRVLIVVLKLFANSPAPAYVVVTGRPSADAATRIGKKMQEVTL
jgi:hypothetical protein